MRIYTERKQERRRQARIRFCSRYTEWILAEEMQSIVRPKKEGWKQGKLKEVTWVWN